MTSIHDSNPGRERFPLSFLRSHFALHKGAMVPGLACKAEKSRRFFSWPTLTYNHQVVDSESVSRKICKFRDSSPSSQLWRNCHPPAARVDPGPRKMGPGRWPNVFGGASTGVSYFCFGGKEKAGQGERWSKMDLALLTTLLWSVDDLALCPHIAGMSIYNFS